MDEGFSKALEHPCFEAGANLVHVELQDTPNPQAMKFIADRVINPGPTRSYRSAKDLDPEADLLAATLFELPGVVGVMLLRDFVTITKRPSARWKTLSPRIERVLIDHFEPTAGGPA
jgi:hypothetical protein